jgi:hypothetical protein
MKRPPRFWARHVDVVADRHGQEFRLQTWGWSDASEAEAASRAADRIRELMARGGPGAAESDWYYPAGPLREQLIEALGDPAYPTAIVTRNRYGVEVLNTDAVVIADIDLPEPPRAGVLSRLFSRGTRPDPADDARVRIGRFASAHPDLGVHSYRTRAGFRVFVTGSGLAPGDERATALLEELGSDPLYVTLCRAQASFRARLTPKPWRVGHRALAVRWPEEDAAWVRDYEARCAGYAVCAHEMSSGPAPTPAEQEILARHDRATIGSTESSLA